MYVIGLDIGTQGVRTLACDAEGNIAAQATEPFDITAQGRALPPGYAEQNAPDWWNAASRCLRRVTGILRESGMGSIDAIAVDSTSGTIVPLDSNGAPLRPAIMYNDSRAEDESVECNTAGSELTEKLGYKFASSFALPKILWVMRHEPDIYRQTACFAHAADYIVGQLTGDFKVSDTSNALKTGYDLVDHRWPDFIKSSLGIPINLLPKVVNPGDVIGTISARCADETGMPAGTPVVAGVTDGTAGFLASGAARVGDWNSTIGTTLVLRGVSRRLIKDPLGRIYCHAHPQGYWLPGGASNVGAEWITKLFHGSDLDEMNARVPNYTPSSLTVYPLARKGERLPFVKPDAEGFVIGEPQDTAELYTAYLEGVGFVERWCLELLHDLGAEVGDTVYTTGGGAKSFEWMQIRANILNKRVVRPASTECAIGTAAVAASGSIYPDLETAVRAMVKPGKSAEPDASKVGIYEERYRIFRKACADRGYE
ncbi:MAG: FGGY-family carbohydrate kinase [Armatimonadota bacterium]